MFGVYRPSDTNDKFMDLQMHFRRCGLMFSMFMDLSDLNYKLMAGVCGPK